MKRLLLGFLVLGFLVGCNTEQADVPTLIAPEDGAKFNTDLEQGNDSTTFQWETGLTIDACYLEITTEESFYPQYTHTHFLVLRDEGGFSGLIYQNGVWTYTACVPSYDIWYWRVFAYSEEDEWSDPSKVWSFELVKE